MISSMVQSCATSLGRRCFFRSSSSLPSTPFFFLLNILVLFTFMPRFLHRIHVRTSIRSLEVTEAYLFFIEGHALVFDIPI
ncbi:hypothetical protein BDV41DRAFT_546181 [Aspergillus transmontanensis]|uniref:Uncharacterized protein n=1 Tax=Aspergillus transmontanensis TaxID=1034304 RepID=A0A5N6VQ72_9EURO|nr:hypothetical protein BDV41DRAFT_546181 [Aspergillus transmontanensis]